MADLMQSQQGRLKQGSPNEAESQKQFQQDRLTKNKKMENTGNNPSYHTSCYRSHDSSGPGCFGFIMFFGLYLL